MKDVSLSGDEMDKHGPVIIKMLEEYGHKHNINPLDLTVIVGNIVACMLNAVKNMSIIVEGKTPRPERGQHLDN